MLRTGLPVCAEAKSWKRLSACIKYRSTHAFASGFPARRCKRAVTETSPLPGGNLKDERNFIAWSAYRTPEVRKEKKFQRLGMGCKQNSDGAIV